MTIKRVLRVEVSFCAMAIVLVAMPSGASAQTAPAPSNTSGEASTAASQPVSSTSAQASPTNGKNASANSDDTQTDIIVTASPTARGLRRMDAAFSAVSLNAEQLKSAGITAPADVLRASPGVFIESSGGAGAGANVEVVGFPSNSLAPFATFELNGTSLFPMAGQTFLDGDNLLRPDDMTERVELVQGGPAVLYGDGQPGLTANYLLKQGTDVVKGSVAATYGFEGYERLDGFVSGPINKDKGLYAAIGGYINRSNGIRSAQFTADKGGQITATLTKKWDDGSSLLVYGKYMNHHDQFVTDTPVILNNDGTFSSYPGFSALTGTLSSKADQLLDLPVSRCLTPGCAPGTVRSDGENARGVIAGTFGGEFQKTFGGGIELLDDFGVTRGVSLQNALYSSPINPQSLASFIALRNTQLKSAYTFVSAALTNNGTAVPLTQNILEAETRTARESFHNVSNEMHLSFPLFPGNTLTFGNRLSVYGVNLFNYQGGDILLQAQNNPAPIAVNVTNGTNIYQLTNSEGFVNGSTSLQSIHGEGVNTAVFISDSWKFGKFLLDFGGRGENQNFTEYLQNTASAKLTPDTTNLWDTGRYLTGTGSTRYHYNQLAVSWTVGLNYTISNAFSGYVRANKGVHFLSMSDVTGLPINNVGPLETAYNYQGGIKLNTSFLYADISGFYRTFRNVPTTISGIPLPGTTTTANGTIVYGSNAPGVQFSVVLTPFAGSDILHGLSVGVSGDYATATYTQSNGCILYTGVTPAVNYCAASLNFTGKKLARQPDFQTRISPNYKATTNWGSVRLFSNIDYIGHRYSDMLQAQALRPYYDLGAGLEVNYGDHIEFLVSGTNLTNQIGITEENPRVSFGSGVPAPGVQLARSIDGRQVLAQLRFKF